MKTYLNFNYEDFFRNYQSEKDKTPQNMSIIHHIFRILLAI